MKSYFSLILGVLVAALATGIVAEVRGDLLYFSNAADKVSDKYMVAIDTYDLSTGIAVSPPNFSFPNAQYPPWEGVAVHDGVLYAGGGNVNGEVHKFNALTGAHIGTGAFVTAPNNVYGMDLDSDGNLYCGMAPSVTSGIARVTPAGVIDSNWGYGLGTGTNIIDVEIFGSTLYAASCSGGGGNKEGIWTFDINTGGAGTQLSGTAGTRVDGLAIVSADTIYSVARGSSINILKWTLSGGTWDSVVLTSMGGSYRYAKDIDYIDGSLFVCATKSSSAAAILKITDLSGTPTVTEWALGSKKRAAFLATGPVPEPSTFVLLATGLIGLLCYAWRKRK